MNDADQLDPAGESLRTLPTREGFPPLKQLIVANLRQPHRVEHRLSCVGKRAERFVGGQGSVADDPFAIFEMHPEVGMPQRRQGQQKQGQPENHGRQNTAAAQIKGGQWRMWVGPIDPGPQRPPVVGTERFIDFRFRTHGYSLTGR
jgi:hypothetical protein